ncbi:hypothetical protein [Syntrophomonas palmitatica]|uniref:hypothetical protein n=1 Tax=Syntrophomonas palmitatica TaxID=402877 RepID=UPI0006D1A1DC|nr:hypothetical protein [Syntrophomonas palmitatica]
MDTITIVPSTAWGDLPEWGEPILRILNERIFLTTSQITKCFPIYGRNNMRRKLNKLADMNYLRRYELTKENNIITGYSIGEEGCRETRKIIPEITYEKALEFIAANEFCFANGIVKPVFWVSKGLTVGEIVINEQKYALWCPRKMDPRINSLKSEVSLSCRGIIIVTPTVKLIHIIAQNLDTFMPVIFTTDVLLTELMEYKNGSIQPI